MLDVILKFVSIGRNRYDKTFLLLGTIFKFDFGGEANALVNVTVDEGNQTMESKVKSDVESFMIIFLALIQSFL